MAKGTSSDRADLAALVDEAPLSTVSVLRMVEPLARAGASAHAQGLALGLCDARRVRATPGGLMARPVRAGYGPGASCDDDVRGLGAILYTLLVGAWPLSAAVAERSGIPLALRDRQGVVVAPEVARPGVPGEVSALVMGALGVGGPLTRVRTCAGVHRLCVQLLISAGEVAVLPAPRDGAPSDPDALWQTASFAAVSRVPRRRRRWALGMGALSLGAVAGLGFVGVHAAVFLELTPPPPARFVLTGAAVAPTGSPRAAWAGGADGVRFVAGRAWSSRAWAQALSARPTPASRRRGH
ncbi:MAG TPA: hypothetical protein VFE65_09290 [Pseudonocardia sp.]|jgi:hypothetical protein|nr:hypothetical protein [Pseudonocardia sp.]